MKKWFIPIFILCSSSAHAAWLYERTVTISSVPSNSGDVTNLPVPLTFSDVTLSTSVSGGHLQNANGFDIKMSSDSSCSTTLQIDTETMNTTGSGTYIGWFSAPVVSSWTTHTVWLCYGNSSITHFIGTSTSTWDSSYVYGSHTQLIGSTVSLNDFTRVNSTGSFVGYVSSITAVIDGGIQTPQPATGGVDNYFDTGYKWANGQSLTETIGFWTNAPAQSGIAVSFLTDSASGISQESLIFQNSATNWEILFGDADLVTCIFTDTVGPDGNWHYVVAEVNGDTGSGSTCYLYVDGSLHGSHSTSTQTGSYSSGSTYHYGNTASGFTVPLPYAGDQLTISTDLKSADYINATYKSQVIGNTFLVVGAETPITPSSSSNAVFFGTEM